MTCEMLLEFHGKNPELTKTLFRENSGKVRIAVRGKTPGAQKDAGTFQWSSAVRALSIILTKAALGSSARSDEPTASLRGFAGSLAASLDYAMSKEPTWTVDMFGVDVSGRSIIRRLISRTNADRKLPGPVILGVKSEVLPSRSINIWWNGARVSDAIVLKSLVGLLELQAGTVSGGQPTMESPEEYFLKKAQAA